MTLMRPVDIPMILSSVHLLCFKTVFSPTVLLRRRCVTSRQDIAKLRLCLGMNSLIFPSSSLD